MVKPRTRKKQVRTMTKFRTWLFNKHSLMKLDDIVEFLAEKGLSYSISNISNMLSGKKKCYYSTWKRIATAIGCEVSDIAAEEDIY